MVSPALAALAVDAADLAALLWLAADAAAKRGEEDTQRVLRLAARQAETIAERVEQLDGEHTEER
jgi:hypothetical protein